MARNPSVRIGSRVFETATASPQEARDHFEAKLRFETDPSDVHADLETGAAEFVLLDPRSPESFAKEHIPEAVNLHYRKMNPESTAKFAKDKPIVVYCAGVHCNASTKGALRLSELGFRVKEMLHGLEGWKAEGYAVESAGTPARLAAANRN